MLAMLMMITSDRFSSHCYSVVVVVVVEPGDENSICQTGVSITRILEKFMVEEGSITANKWQTPSYCCCCFHANSGRKLKRCQLQVDVSSAMFSLHLLLLLWASFLCSFEHIFCSPNEQPAQAREIKSAQQMLTERSFIFALVGIAADPL